MIAVLLVGFSESVNGVGTRDGGLSRVGRMNTLIDVANAGNRAGFGRTVAVAIPIAVLDQLRCDGAKRESDHPHPGSERSARNVRLRRIEIRT